MSLIKEIENDLIIVGFSLPAAFTGTAITFKSGYDAATMLEICDPYEGTLYEFAVVAAMLDAYEGAVPPPEVFKYREVFSRRKTLLSDALEKQGFVIFRTDATFYIWFRVGDDELPFIARALGRGVLLTPGSGFGSNGKGWVRASVTAPDETISAAAEILTDLI